MALAVVDVNLILYAFNPKDGAHSVARRWLEETLSGDDILAVPMLAIAAFLRVSTHHSLDRLPQRMEEALTFIEDLLENTNVRVLHTDGGHWAELKRVLEESGVHGRTITDAQFAALAIQHHGTLYSADKHFHRFPRLRWKNPLSESNMQ